MLGWLLGCSLRCPVHARALHHPPASHPPACSLTPPTPPIPAAPCEVHGEGCKSLMPHASHKADASQVVGIYMMEAGIIFHSGVCVCGFMWGWVHGCHWGVRGWVEAAQRRRQAGRWAGSRNGARRCLWAHPPPPLARPSGPPCSADWHHARCDGRGRLQHAAGGPVLPPGTYLVWRAVWRPSFGCLANHTCVACLHCMSSRVKVLCRFHLLYCLSPPPVLPLQFFEGFAIGSAVVDSGLGVMKSCMMGLAYSITTPLGIAIGKWSEGAMVDVGPRGWSAATAAVTGCCQSACLVPQQLHMSFAHHRSSASHPSLSPAPCHPPTAQALGCVSLSTPTPRPRCWWRASSTPSPRVGWLCAFFRGWLAGLGLWREWESSSPSPQAGGC